MCPLPRVQMAAAGEHGNLIATFGCWALLAALLACAALTTPRNHVRTEARSG